MIHNICYFRCGTIALSQIWYGPDEIKIKPYELTRSRLLFSRSFAARLPRSETIMLNCFSSAGELTSDELERIVLIMQNPRQYKVPDWFLNRQKDIKDGKYSHLLANGVDNAMREDLERLKKIRAHRGLRHYWGLRVRGQHTKTTGRRGRTVGVSKKKGGN